MADTGKSVRVSRTNIREPGSVTAPTQRTQIVEHEVHQYRSLGTGLESLGQVFSNFFNQASSALDSVREGVAHGEAQRIKQENAAQKRQALGDALTGKNMDPELVGDLDYYDAFRSVTAQRDGFSAYQDFHKWYLNDWLPENPTGDLMAARERWASENLTGSDDADYEGQVLASFFNQSDSLISTHEEAAVKFQTAKGIEALGSAIDAEVAGGTMSAATLASFIEKARILDPLNSAEAPARVASALLASANNHPERMMAVAGLLEEPGTGVNGKSFAQSWPETYSKYETDAVSNWQSINTTKEMVLFSALDDRLREAKTSEDLVQLSVDVLKFRQTHGALGKTGELLDQIAVKAAKIDKTETAFQGIDAYLLGDTGAVSPADLRKNWSDYMEQRVGTRNIMDPRIEHEQAASIIQGLKGVIPEEVKNQVSSAITNTKDGASQVRAINLINDLTATTGKEYAKDYLSATAAQMYEQVAAISQVSSEPMESIISRVNEARDGVKDWNADWKTITGAADSTKAEDSVRKVINDNLWTTLGQPGWLGGSLPFGGRGVTIPPTLDKTIMDVARQKAIEAGANGRGWEEGVKDAISSIAANAEIIPGANGQLLLQLDADKDTRYIGEDGVEATRPRLGFAVPNPTTGQMVDTMQVYQDQLDALSLSDNWVFQDGSTDGVSLSPRSNSVFTASGLLEVYQDGEPITFAAGDEITRTVGKKVGLIAQVLPGLAPTRNGGSQTLVLPDTVDQMNSLIPDLPQGFKFVRQETPYGVVWQLGFRPNFGDQTGKTLDQQIEDFTPPEDQDGGVGIREMLTGEPPDPLWSR